MKIISVGEVGENIIVSVALDAVKFRQDNAIPPGEPLTEAALSKETLLNYLMAKG